MGDVTYTTHYLVCYFVETFGWPTCLCYYIRSVSQGAVNASPTTLWDIVLLYLIDHLPQRAQALPLHN